LEKDALYWIRKLALLPHPEGGYYRETYRSEGGIPAQTLPPPFKGERAYSTAIYFLLEEGNFSAFHRIASDEIWHFYAGDELQVYVIRESGELETIRLGNDPEKGQLFQHVVPAGLWFASRVEKGFALAGCTVAPGFDFTDFEMAERTDLLRKYPQHEQLILELTRD
jgi:predicted cupin superfamily sugar epimerase